MSMWRGGKTLHYVRFLPLPSAPARACYEKEILIFRLASPREEITWAGRVLVVFCRQDVPSTSEYTARLTYVIW